MAFAEGSVIIVDYTGILYCRADATEMIPFKVRRQTVADEAFGKMCLAAPNPAGLYQHQTAHVVVRVAQRGIENVQFSPVGAPQIMGFHGVVLLDFLHQI